MAIAHRFRHGQADRDYHNVRPLAGMKPLESNSAEIGVIMLIFRKQWLAEAPCNQKRHVMSPSRAPALKHSLIGGTIAEISLASYSSPE